MMAHIGLAPSAAVSALPLFSNIPEKEQLKIFGIVHGILWINSRYCRSQGTIRQESE